MPTTLLNCNNAKIVHLLCFITSFYSINGIQHLNQTTWDPETIKHLEDQAFQQLEKIKFCKTANITFIVLNLGENTIRVVFKLIDAKFQDCFKYFELYLEKQRRIIRKIKLPYSHNKLTEVSYRFENVSCGLYEAFVRPFCNDRSPMPFRWSYGYPINVTSNDCLGNLKKNPTSDKNKIVAILSSVSAFVFLVVICLLTSCYHLSGKYRLKKFRNNTSVAECKYGKIDTNDDNKTEIKSVYVYIFHSYNNRENQDEEKTIKSKVEALKDLLTLLLKHLFDARLPTGQNCFLYSSIKTIDSEFPKILFNVNDWLKDVLDEKGKDGILRKIILVETEIEEENEDSLENLIFSEIKDKLRSNKSRCLDGYNSLFVVRLNDRDRNYGPHGKDFYGSSNDSVIPLRKKFFDLFLSCVNFLNSKPSRYNLEGNLSLALALPTYSEDLKDMVRGCRYYIPTHLVDLCFDLCSGSALDALEDKKNLKIILQQHLDEYLGVQNV